MNHSESSEQLRAGFIGVGGFGAQRREWVRQSRRFEIVAGFDVSPEAIDTASKEEGPQFEIARNIDALVNRDDLDVIFVTTPAHLHVEHAMAAARAGKHVFVEKPLADELHGARELVKFCRDHDRQLGVGFTMRQQPGALLIKRLIESGELGAIVAADVYHMHRGGLTFPTDNWRFRPERNPGGPLLQLGVHDLDLLRWWFGDGEVISAIARNGISGKPTPDGFTVLLRFGDIPATLHAHYVCPSRYGAQIFGSKANVYYTYDPESVMIQRPRGGDAEPIETLELPKVSEADAMREFASAIREGKHYRPDGDDGVATLQMLFDAIASAERSER